MLARRTHPAATQSTRRTEAFTDGVFAIAATLLVLDLTAHTFGTVTSDGDLANEIVGMWPLFFNFILSFLLLCLLWMTHAQQFEFIARVDGVVVWLNNLRLLFIVLVPFATGLMTEYQLFLIGRVAMPLTFFFAVLFGTLQWAWAVRRRERMLPDLTDAQARALGRGAWSALIIAGAVVLASAVVGSFAFVLFFLDPLVTRLLNGGHPVVQPSEPATDSEG
jgi:uncharacterized membrane protein